MTNNSKLTSNLPKIEDEDILDEYDFSQAIRGNPYHFGTSPSITLHTPEGDRSVTLKTLEVTATVTDSGILTLQLPSDISPGEHRITLLIQETLA